MKKCTILCALICLSISSMGQGVVYIEYKDGRSIKEEINNINNISFHHLDELPSDPIITDVSRGLLAYYTFDNETANDTQNRYNGFSIGGTYIADTPSGEGKALFLKRGERVYIPFAPFNGLKNYTISIWVKDFGSGPLFQTYNDYVYGPTLYITEEIKARNYTSVSWSSDHYNTFSTDLTSYQSEKWTMITIVTNTSGNDSQGVSYLYINGQLMESSKSYTNNNSGAVAMSIGGYAWAWADPMKVDNVRLYDVALNENEIANIYNREKQPRIITVSPQSLFFDKDTDKKSITLSNNSPRLSEYVITSNNDIFDISSKNSFIPAKSSKTIDINIKDRSNIEDFTKGTITIENEGMYTSIDVIVEKGANASSSSVAVSRGLQAYYNFDNETIEDIRNGYNGTVEGGTYISDTPNGKGKSLSLKKGEYVDIPYSPLDGKKNYTVSFWLKDFGSGYPLRSYNDYLYGPSVFITEEMKPRIYTGVSWSSDNYFTFGNALSDYQSEEWTMITIVTSTSGNNSNGTNILYINGHRSNTGTSYTNNNTGTISMSIGSENTDPFKIDNMRFYSVALTDDEVLELYNAESK